MSELEERSQTANLYDSVKMSKEADVLWHMLERRALEIQRAQEREAKQRR